MATRIKIAGSAVALLISATQALSCDLVMRATGTITYAPDSLAREAVNLHITARGDATTCAGATISIEPLTGNASLQGIGDALPIEGINNPLVQNLGDIFHLTNQARMLLVEQSQLSVSLGELPPERFVPPGPYRAQFRLKTDGTVSDDAEIIAQVRFATRLATNQARVISLDFDEAATGKTVFSDFLYQSNAPLSLTVRSDNGGKLTHTDNPALSPIPYRASVAGRAVALDGSGTVSLGTPTGNNGIDSARVSFTIGELPPAYAGQYEDRVTIALIGF